MRRLLDRFRLPPAPTVAVKAPALRVRANGDETFTLCHGEREIADFMSRGAAEAGLAVETRRIENRRRS